MNRSLSILLFVALFWGCATSPQPKSEAGRMLAKAADFLWNQQGEDGGWHSQTHGILKGGQVCTAFVLDALLAVPDSIYQIDTDKKEEGLAFIVNHVNAEGALGKNDPDLMEYPNYATAFGAKVLLQHGTPDQESKAGEMMTYLLNQQLVEKRGFQVGHAAYGGWGFGEVGISPENPGHVDLSHTRRILEALRCQGRPSTEVQEKVGIFLLRLQKSPVAPQPTQGLLSQFKTPQSDGGFLYSPVQEDVNKGGWAADSGQYMQSYATATCDGLLAAATLNGCEGMVADAKDWLEANGDWSAPAGVPTDHFQQWHKVMYYYHLSVRAQAYRAAFMKGWQTELMDELRGKQAEDGHFSNPDGAANKENDPLIATALVVKALCAAMLP